MKRINFYYFLLSISLFVFSSCNKDDDPKIDPVVGKWELNYVKIEIKNNQAAADTINGNYSPFQYSGVARIVLDIDQAKTFEETYILLDGKDETEDGSWEKSEQTLTLKYSQDDLTYSIVSNTTGELMLQIDDQLRLRDPNFPGEENKYVLVDATFTYKYTK